MISTDLKSLAALVSLIAIGCAPTLSRPARSMETLPAFPACEKTGTHTGTSWLNGWLFPAEARARGEALDAAVLAGASHVVWVHSHEGLTGARAVAIGFRCGQ